ncbi:tol-pal system protein YbgF [bacterium]|nr:tol-pal system protein YbgF [bacterium]
MKGRYKGIDFLRLISIALTLFAPFFYFGCATMQDITFANQKILNHAKLIEGQGEAIKQLEAKDSGHDFELQALKKSLADISIQLQNDREQLLTLEAKLEDYRQLIDRSLKENSRENEGIRMRLDRMDELVKSMSKRFEAVPDPRKGIPSPQGISSIPSGKTWEDMDEETFYNLAYETFKKGEFDTAREIFSAFLDKFPKGKFSDNATFWIGECYYRKNQYEQAILEYEKVKKNYPSGDKVPSALFKQALSFQKLNKKDEANIILKSLIQHYPESEQAEMAKEQMEKFK